MPFPSLVSTTESAFKTRSYEAKNSTLLKMGGKSDNFTADNPAMDSSNSNTRNPCTNEYRHKVLSRVIWVMQADQPFLTTHSPGLEKGARVRKRRQARRREGTDREGKSVSERVKAAWGRQESRESPGIPAVRIHGAL